MIRREVLLCVLALVTLSQAATIWTVTSNADAGPGSLRAIVASAASGDSIKFASRMTINLSTGTININKTLAINGDVNANGLPDDVTINANWKSQIFYVTAPSSTFYGLRLLKGSGVQGGAFFTNAPSTTINRCYIAHSISSDNGGGAEVAQWGSTAVKLTVLYSTFYNNTATYAGGAIGVDTASLKSTGNLFQNNKAYRGGAIGHWNAGQTSIYDSTFSGNQAAPSVLGLTFYYCSYSAVSNS